MNLNLDDKLTFLIVDKVLIGVLLVIFGFFLKLIIIQFTARLALESKIAEERVIKIGETWSKVYEYQHQVLQFIDAIMMAIQKFPDDREARKEEIDRKVGPLKEDMIAGANAVPKFLEEQRFWLGESIYKKFQDHSEKIYNLMVAASEMDIKEVMRLKTEFERNWVSIIDYVRKPLLKDE